MFLQNDMEVGFINKILFVFIPILLLTGCFTFSDNEEESAIKTEALNYLKEKYNKEFVINKSEKNRSSGLYKINVSPKNDLEHNFFVFVYERDMDFNDNYLKSLIANEIQRRDNSKLKELFPSKLHSFYGNLVFEDELLPNLKEISVSSILSQNVEILHDYVIYFDGSLSVDSDIEKLALLILYLKGVDVKVADIDFVFFNTKPSKSASESPSYYLKDKGVDQVLSIQPEQYKELNTKKEVEDFINNLLEG